MVQPREIIAVAIAFAALLFVTLFFGICAFLANQADLAGNTWPGRTYIRLMLSADDIRSIFAIALIVITAGVNIVGRHSTPSWMLYGSSALCIAGLAACFVLLVALKDFTVARPMWSLADEIMNYDQLQESNRHFLELVAAWLGTFLATVLGIAVSRGTSRAAAPSAGEHAPPERGSAALTGSPASAAQMPAAIVDGAGEPIRPSGSNSGRDR